MNPDVDDRDPRDESEDDGWDTQFRNADEYWDWISVFEAEGVSI